MLNIFVSACLYSNNAVTVREASYGAGRQLRYGKAVTVQEGSYGAGRDPASLHITSSVIFRTAKVPGTIKY